jgi:hypothetical protein
MTRTAMATDTEQSTRDEQDVEATMDGGLCRLEPPGLADLDDDEVVAPRHETTDD